MLVAYALLVSIAPINSPVLPLKLTTGMKPTIARVGKTWSNGTYQVSWDYESARSFDELTTALRREFPDAHKPSSKMRTYTHIRVKDGIWQVITIDWPYN